MRLGGSVNDIAFYQAGDAAFALIPGAMASLGYDPDRAWEPNLDELESWRETADEYEIAKSIQEEVADLTLRVRQVEISPILIETTAGELGWERIGTDDPEVQDILQEFGARQQQSEICREEFRTRVRRGHEKEIIAERSFSRTHADLAAQLAATGFRFPTSDEWEYACGGGAETLFRWGDHVPCDRDPAENFTSDWDYHRQPNAFGLMIASDPYKYELVAEVGVTRGGGGGSLICGGAGFFVSWLTLATAYFEEDSCKYDPTKQISNESTIGRRVLELR